MTKQTDILVKAERQIGTEPRLVRYFARDVSGAEVPVDETRDFPIFEPVEMTLQGIGLEELARYTDDALSALVVERFGPGARLTAVTHRTYEQAD